MTDMRKILLFAFVMTAVMMMNTGCKMAPKEHLGDTVAASVFYPADTSAVHARRQAVQQAQASVKDSADLFIIGSESSRELLQLVSYPSRRDTMFYGKSRHLKVQGCADFGHLVRVTFFVLTGGDSIVSRVVEVKPATPEAPAVIPPATSAEPAG